jgi:hypothetical protein
VDPSVSPEQAVFVEPLSCVVNGLAKLQITPGDKALIFGAGHDEQVGIQLACGQRDVDVVGIGRQRADQAAGTFDARLQKHCVLGGVALDAEKLFLPKVPQRLGVFLDHHERHGFGDQLLTHDAAHAAEAADDEVIGQLRDLSFHFAPPKGSLKLPLDDLPCNQARAVQDDAQAAENQQHGKELPGGPQRLHLAVADRRESDHGHVEGINETHPHDDHVPQRADAGEAEQGNEGDQDRPARHAGVLSAITRPSQPSGDPRDEEQ